MPVGWPRRYRCQRRDQGAGGSGPRLRTGSRRNGAVPRLLIELSRGITSLLLGGRRGSFLRTVFRLLGSGLQVANDLLQPRNGRFQGLDLPVCGIERPLMIFDSFVVGATIRSAIIPEDEPAGPLPTGAPKG